MLIELRPGTPAGVAEEVAAQVAGHEDVTAWHVRLGGRTFVVVSGDESLARVPGSPAVLARHRTPDGYLLVRKSSGVAPSEVTIGGPEGAVVGGGRWWWAAGPCAVEGVDDAVEAAMAVGEQGASAVRASLFKTRSSPYHFPGKGGRGLEVLAEIRSASGLPVITEVYDPRDVAAVAEVADCLQVDGRQLDNRPLLAELGAQPRPVLLMRHPRAELDDWLRAAEFVLTRGNRDVVLCAGAAGTPPVPDFGAIPALRERTGLPVVFDPSHSTRSAARVAPAALAAAAHGADGLLIESCPRPERTYRPGDAAHMFPPEHLARLAAACEQARDLARALVPR